MTPDPVARAVAGLEPVTPARRVLVWNGAARWASPLEAMGWKHVTSGPADLVVVSFLQERGVPARRADVLMAVADRLVPTGHVLVIDHNRPRRRFARLGATLALWSRGMPLRRAAYPTAREIAARGYDILRLVLGRGERVQVVLARRRPS